MLRKLVLILCAMALLAIAAFPVHAASFTLDVPVKAVQTCPTIMAGEPPLDRNDIPITVYNQYQYPDNYIFTWTLPAGWPDALFAVSQLGSGESEQAIAFMTVPDVPPGTYPVTLRAESEQTHDTVEKTFDVQVLSCHALSVTAEPSYTKACKETDTSVSYSITLKNSGKAEETFRLEALQNGLNVPYASFSQPSLTVPAGGEMSAALILTPPQDLSGMQDMTIEARSETSTARASADVQLDIGSCYGFDVYITPEDKTLCLGKDVSLALTIENNGDTDTFSVSLPDWVEADTTYVSLPNGQKHAVTLTLSPVKAGDHPLEAVVRSERTGLSQKASASVLAESCKDLAVIISPSEKSVCSGMPASFTVSIKNMGAVQDTVELTSTEGALGQTKVVLEPGETQDVRLDISETEAGRKEIRVIARSDGASDETTGTLVVESCYSASLGIEPAELVTCPCGNLEYSITLENDGKLEDSYTIKFGNTSETVTMGPGEKSRFGYIFSIPCEMEGDYEIRAYASSGHIDTTASSSLKVKADEECWSGSLEAGKTAEVEVYGAAVIPVKVKNTGEHPASYAMSATGPSWVYMEPESLHLQPGSEGEAYVYASPPHGTELGSYEVAIRADSHRSSSSTSLEVKVVEEASGDTAQDQDDITLNASYGTGGVTGNVLAVSAAPAWKTMLVGVITLFVLLILVVKFAGFMKA